MSWKRKINLFIRNEWDVVSISRARKKEIRKFQDKRRVEIYTKVQLSSEQKKEIDSLFLNNYGEKIPYIWHRHFTAFTGNYDKYYFPELLFIPEFQRFMNNAKEYTNTFSDKNVLPLLANSAGVKMPKTIFSCAFGIIQNSGRDILNLSSLSGLSGEFFIKPTVDTSSGAGCQVLNLINGVDTSSNKSLNEIVQEKGSNWVIQERIKCHSSISVIYPNSVNTFRIMTYIWKGEICHAPVIMRIGQGGANVDNAHAGGMFIAIDDDGTLHEKAFTEFKQEFYEHPNTNLVFKNHIIEDFPKVLSAAIRCHSFIPQIGCINWDFTIDESGNPVLIEANLRAGSIWLFQMAHGRGIFGEKTPEILRWMKQMKQLKMNERYKYAYGSQNY